MFIDPRAAARFAPDRPLPQLVANTAGMRAVVFGLEPGQAIPPHTSTSTVLMQAVEGRGRFRVGDEERAVRPGDVAICPPRVPHALAADSDSRLIVLAIIAPRP